MEEGELFLKRRFISSVELFALVYVRKKRQNIEKNRREGRECFWDGQAGWF